jgi:hypothetical protein
LHLCCDIGVITSQSYAIIAILDINFKFCCHSLIEQGVISGDVGRICDVGNVRDVAHIDGGVDLFFIS